MKSYFALLFFLFSAAACASTYPVIRPQTPFSGSRFFAPNDSAKHTSIVMLHGSEGGSEHSDSEASILATQGYAVLRFCYFDCNRGLTGPRESLLGVEATKVLDAVAWLRARPQSNGKVVVYGFSRGAELALIIGGLPMTQNNRPSAIIAHSPSDVFVGPFSWSWREPACWLCTAGIGKCSAVSPKSAYEWNPACGPNDPRKIDRTVSAWLVSGKSIPDRTRVEIEKYEGPLLITVGDNDEVWPVDQTKRIETTLKASGRKPEIHYFVGAGHGFRGKDEINRRLLVLDFLGRVP